MPQRFGRLPALVSAIVFGLLLSGSIVLGAWAAPAVPPPTFVVNDAADVVAAAQLDDGRCNTAYLGGVPNGDCTLRAAIMKANHWPGGGIFDEALVSNTVILRNSVLSANHNTIFIITRLAWPNDCHGQVTTGAYDLISDATDCGVVSGQGDVFSTTAHLGPLQDNGGPTWTQALLPGSPALDAGNPLGCKDQFNLLLAIDRRGYGRAANVQGVARCDIGAYEAQRALFLPVVRR